MVNVISVCFIKGQLVFSTIGGQPVQEDTISSMVQEPKPEMVSTNRVQEKPREYEYRKDVRRKKNTKAKADHNKWKSQKRKQK